jgi:protein-disulfide isomerase
MFRAGPAVRAAPFALLRNSRKPERGAKLFLAGLVVRAAPFALFKELALPTSHRPPTTSHQQPTTDHQQPRYNQSMRFAVLTALCLCLLPAIFAQEKPKSAAISALDKAQFETYVRHLLAVVPEVAVKIEDPKPSSTPELLEVDVHFTYQGRSQDDTYYITKDGQHIIRGVVYNFAENPFKEDLDKLKTSGAPSFGSASAPVTLVEFGDFECPNCKEEAKTLRDNLPVHFPNQFRLVFKDFPLEQIHPWAKSAAIAGRCVFQQSPAAFWKFHDWIYEHQTDIATDNLKTQVLDFAKSAQDVDALQLGRCIDTKATEAEVDASIAEARALHVDATPTVFLNGRRLVGNYPWQNLEQIINGELTYQKAAQNAPPSAASGASDKCCEVKIPSPLSK